MPYLTKVYQLPIFQCEAQTASHDWGSPSMLNMTIQLLVFSHTWWALAKFSEQRENWGVGVA